MGAVGQLFSGWLVALPGVDSHPRQPTLLGRPDAPGGVKLTGRAVALLAPKLSLPPRGERPIGRRSHPIAPLEVAHPGGDMDPLARDEVEQIEVGSDRLVYWEMAGLEQKNASDGVIPPDVERGPKDREPLVYVGLVRFHSRFPPDYVASIRVLVVERDP